MKNNVSPKLAKIITTVAMPEELKRLRERTKRIVDRANERELRLIYQFSCHVIAVSA